MSKIARVIRWRNRQHPNGWTPWHEEATYNTTMCGQTVPFKNGVEFEIHTIDVLHTVECVQCQTVKVYVLNKRRVIDD